MSQNENRASIRFDLNESLYFEKGQEVLEMMSISLDPNISIHTFHDNVSIRGVIELQGEYRKVPSQIEDDVTNISEFHAKRFVEKVEEITDQTAQFSHRFPVEISVPAERIKNKDDVTVSIASFDYELPSEDHLKLISTVEIHGISEDVNFPEYNENEEVSEREEATEADNQLEDEPAFQIDLKQNIENNKQVDEERTEEKEDVKGDVKKEQVETKKEKRKDKIEVKEETDLKEPLPEATDSESQEDEKDRWKFKETKSLQEFFKEKKEEAKEEATGDSAIEVEVTEDAITIEGKESVVETEINGQQDEDEESLRDQVDDYLTSIFKEDVRRSHAKLRLCIVQENDTIESIAKRYKISALQLLKKNRLSEDNLTEGQLLYIPYKKN